jgi:hypothetical protein
MAVRSVMHQSLSAMVKDGPERGVCYHAVNGDARGDRQGWSTAGPSH